MAQIKGIEIILIDKQIVEEDPFGAPVYEDVEIPVENVLIGEPSTEEVTNTLSLYGRKLAYTLAIPKGDTNNWENKEVRFFNQKFKTIGIPTQGIEDMMPLEWNKKVKVERHE